MKEHLGQSKLLTENPLLRLYLFGPFSLLGQDGTELAPKSKKSRAVLAMLALAPRGARSRVWLRHKLWSDKSEAQSAASLRQSLLEIRRSLGPIETRAFQTDQNTVTLNLDVVDIDLMQALKGEAELSDSGFTGPAGEDHFLEDLDINDAEFQSWRVSELELWLQRFQSNDVQRPLAPASPVAARAEAPKENIARGNWPVILRPPRFLNDPKLGLQLANATQATLVRSLREVGDFTILSPESAGDLMVIPNSENDVDAKANQATVSFTYFSGNDAQRALVQVFEGVGEGRSWHSDVEIPGTVRNADPTMTHNLVRGAVDQLMAFFVGPAPYESASGRFRGATALSRMLELSRDDLKAAEEILNLGLKDQPNAAQAHALMAFLITFQIGQRFRFEDSDLIERAQEHAALARELSTDNALISALVAHVHSYLFGEYDFAAGLFETALRQNPTQTLAWDLYSMLHTYAGQPRPALSMARWACHLGQFSPYRYYFETSRAISACFAGEHVLAVEAAKYALSERPQFNSLLRVLVSSMAHLENIDAAELYLEKLNSVEPNFSIEGLKASGYPGLETAGGRHFLEGLAKAGVPNS
ncbi:MAG: SARP family transcriptional regulator [Pseudomonadota bacterium]